MNHAQWETTRTRRALGERVETSPEYIEVAYALALGEALYNRCTELGLTQTEVAERRRHGTAQDFLDRGRRPRACPPCHCSSPSPRLWTRT